MSGANLPFLAKLKDMNQGDDPGAYLNNQMRQNMKAIQTALLQNSNAATDNSAELENIEANLNNTSASLTIALDDITMLNTSVSTINGQIATMMAQIAALQPNFQSSPDIITYTNATSTYTDVASVSITTTGKPVVLLLMAATGGAMILQNSTTGAQSNIKLDRSGTDLGINQITGPTSVPGIMFADHPAAGTFTYRIQGMCPVPTGLLNIAFTRLVAIEV